MQLSSIMTVLDKPKHPQTALATSAHIQALSQAKLDMVAFRWDPFLESSSMFDAKQRRRLRHGVNVDCETWQAQLAEKFKLDAQRTTSRMVWTKDMGDWIVDELSENPKDLLVKTVHGEKTLMYTPTDWELLRACPTPILFTKPTKKKHSNRILAALDFSRDDVKHNRLNSKILQAASCFAELTGAELHCVYGLEISPVLRDLDIVDAKVSKKRFLETSSAFIERTLQPFRIPNSRRHFLVGKAGQVTNTKAHQLNAELIVMGTSAHRVKQVIGLGHVAARILSKARRDVLVVHP